MSMAKQAAAPRSSDDPQAALRPTEPPRGSGLETQAESHDHQQFEIRFNYALEDTGPQRYAVDTYIFTPRNVGVNRTNFPRDVFYADVTALMRLDAAPLPLTLLANPSCEASPLSRFAAAAESFRSSPRPPPSRPVAIHVKLYAHMLVVAVSEETERLVRMGRELGRTPERTPERLEGELLSALERMRQALKAFRTVRAAFWPFERLCHRSLVEAMRASDEYMSLVVEERLARFVTEVQEAVPAQTHPGLAVKLRLHASVLAREEAGYRRKYGYLALTSEGLAMGEYFAYRASLLKKSVQQALYLDPREVRVDTFLRNAVGAVAAALGAIWATALAMQLPMNLGSLPSDTRTFFFAAAVIAYVLKDRIKAMTGEWLGQRLRRHDHTSWLYGDSLETVGLGMLRARQREAMRFLSPAEVPERIRNLRLSHRTVQNAEPQQEEVIHYRKTLDVGKRDEAARLPEGYRVRDIMRLNVRHFLVRLDDPTDRVEFFDPVRGAFSETSVPKVYHLNVVVKVTHTQADGTGRERLEHLRVIINKEGIVRIETLGGEGPTALPPRKAFRLPIRLRLPLLGR